MDDWGDPWAENSPGSTQKELGTLGKFKQEGASVALENEAQWGEDDDFGDFEGFTGVQEPQVNSVSIGVPAFGQNDEALSIETPRSLGTKDEALQETGNEARAGLQALELPNKYESSTPGEKEHVVSQPTTLEPTLDSNADAIAAHTAPSAHSAPAESSQAESSDHDDLTEPSASTSETSMVDVLASESPRTSFDDEYTTTQAVKATEKEIVVSESIPEEEVKESRAVPAKSDLEDLEDKPAQNDKDVLNWPASSTAEASKESPNSSTVTFDFDLSLVKQLFPVPRTSDELTQVSEDMISSTSARKAWYRITRKETLRQYNKGEDDAHYVRVGWQSSAIRTQTSAVVARWAAEDRIHGRVVLGGRPSVIFGWDESGKEVHPNYTGRSRQKSFASPTVPQWETKSFTHTPERREAVSVPASAIAQFSWSSSPASDREPQHAMQPPTSVPSGSPGTIYSSVKPPWGPLAAWPSQHSLGRPLSWDVHNHLSPKSSHTRASKSISHTRFPPKHGSIDEAFNQPESGSSISGSAESAGLDSVPRPTPLDTNSLTKLSISTESPTKQVQSDHIDMISTKPSSDGPPQTATVFPAPALAMLANDEDDEWGEMVQSPISPTRSTTTPKSAGEPYVASFEVDIPSQATLVPPPAPLSPHRSAAATPPSSGTNPWASELAAETAIPSAPVAVNTPSLLLLESIPPTSFAPVSPSSERSQTTALVPPPSQPSKPDTQAPAPPAPSTTEDLDFSIFAPTAPLSVTPTSPTFPPNSANSPSHTPPTAFTPLFSAPASVPVVPDPLMDADFSIFEMPPDPPPPPAPLPAEPPPHSPARTPPVPPPKDFSPRRPPIGKRRVTPQEFVAGGGGLRSGAMGTKKTRREEEEEVVRRIVQGLPRLGYMLR